MIPKEHVPKAKLLQQPYANVKLVIDIQAELKNDRIQIKVIANPEVSLIPLRLPVPTMSHSNRQNVFHFEADAWWLYYAGKGVPKSDELGLKQIQFLMRNGLKGFTPLEVIAACGQQAPISPEARGMAVDLAASQREQAKIAAADSTHVNAKLTPETIKQVQRAIDDLEMELQDTNENSNPERVLEIERHLSAFHAYLNKGSRRGKSKSFVDNNERARHASRKAISRAIAHLRPIHPSLAEHLHNSLQLHEVFGYFPAKLISWRF